uniref:DRBM domain-containing protein n=1 Tax=Panagrolaimus sp. JU765 TaxID=591449 RepID=A0AC34RRA6_9BILA
MNLSLLSIVEELSQKQNSRRPQHECVENTSRIPKLFQAKITFTFSSEQFIGEGLSVKKKAAQHLAAGDVLLQLVEHAKWKDLFPQFEQQSDAREMIQSKLDDFDKDTTVINPVVSLCQFCKESGLNDPDFHDVTAIHNTYASQCIVANKFTTQGEGSNKKAAKAVAAENMLNLLKETYSKSIQAKATAPKLYSKSSTMDSAMDEPKEISMRREIKNKICKDISNALNKETKNDCIKMLEKQRDTFGKMYGREFDWKWYSHKSKDLTKVLESLHSIDLKKQNKQKRLVNEAVLQSFFGYGDSEECARNEAARFALIYLQNWIEQRVIVLDDLDKENVLNAAVDNLKL